MAKRKSKKSVKVNETKRDNGGVAEFVKNGTVIKTVTWTKPEAKPDLKAIAKEL